MTTYHSINWWDSHLVTKKTSIWWSFEDGSLLSNTCHQTLKKIFDWFVFRVGYASPGWQAVKAPGLETSQSYQSAVWFKKKGLNIYLERSTVASSLIKTKGLMLFINITVVFFNFFYLSTFLDTKPKWVHTWGWKLGASSALSQHLVRTSAAFAELRKMCELAKHRDVKNGEVYCLKLSQHELLSVELINISAPNNQSHGQWCQNLTGDHVNLFLTQWHLEVTVLSWRLSMLTRSWEVFPLRLVLAVPPFTVLCIHADKIGPGSRKTVGSGGCQRRLCLTACKCM